MTGVGYALLRAAPALMPALGVGFTNGVLTSAPDAAAFLGVRFPKNPNPTRPSACPTVSL